jgi:hypothetical protein
MTPILVEVVRRSRAEKLFVAEDFIIAETHRQDYRVLAVSPKNDALILLDRCGLCILCRLSCSH